MAFEQDGYAVVQLSDGMVIEEWASAPAFVDTPDGNRHYAPRVGFEHGGFRFVERWSDVPSGHMANLTNLLWGATAWNSWAGRVERAGSVAPVPTETIALRCRSVAHQRIIEEFPEWRQRNAIARSVELLEKGSDTWTADEQSEVVASQAVWAWVKRVRAASNTIEADPPADGDFQNDPRWPAPFGT